MIKGFFDKLWNENKDFITHIIGHGVKIVISMVILKLIYIISDFLFSEKPKMLQYMENLSSWGMLAIFFILLIFEIYDLIRKSGGKL